MATQPRRIGFLLWPTTHALTLSLAREVLRAAWRLHPETLYEPLFLLTEALAEEEGWRPSETAWNGRLERYPRLFLVTDEASAATPPTLGLAFRQLARSGAVIGTLSTGVYPLAQLGLFDDRHTAVHRRWHNDFTERSPKVITTSHLFEWDRDRMTACDGMAVLDLLLALLSRGHGVELAGVVLEELVVEHIREGSEHQRIPLKNRLGSSHPKLTQAVLLTEANIEESLTTDEIAQYVCVSQRQLERVFKQYLNRVSSQYYLELRLNRTRRMLMQTSKSIIQIDLSCSFSSGPHFLSAYHNFFGVTPREDRNQRRDDSAFEATFIPVKRG